MHRIARLEGSATPPARFVCVHGHFYQPPRENPWLETVEVQDSAAPYHDWNDRITAECYAPNGASRIVNLEDDIIRIVNNYSRMSFNFGPTLLSWLHDFAPRTYRMILDADRFSQLRYSGHGSAMAQVYNHIIMPLASTRDALTQIRWGIADFESRFHRKPEGMWLAETAVSRHVLDLLAQEGIKYTILAPVQCARVRRIPKQDSTVTEAAEAAVIDWTETPNATVDPTHPYTIQLDEGRSIAVFFYDGPNSRAIAFEGLLNSGEDFARRLLSGLHADNGEAQLSHVATDGESYGHHHKHGEMALSYAMHWISEGDQADLTNYGEFLERFPPQWQAEVAEDTSWSCVHGIERWRSNCGCNGGKPGWNQEWRGPLRNAFDFLRDATAPLAEKLAEGLLKDLWIARDAYIHVILHRTHTDKFLAEHATHPLTPAERTTVLELMELERHTQLMYTSCGWFFDEVSGIETVQIIAYAGRVLQLAAKLFGEPGAALEKQFLDILETAKSNIPEIGTGAEVYRRYVTSMKIGLEAVGAHYAISSIFRSYPEDGELFCFDLHRDSHEVFTSGRGRVALGRALIRSRITEETETICFAVLHLGDQNLSAAVKRYNAEDPAEVAALPHLLHRHRLRHAPRQPPRGHPPHRPLLRPPPRHRPRRHPRRHHRLLPHLALRRRAAPHPQDHPQPDPLRDGGLPPQDLRGPRLPHALPHRVRHVPAARPRPRRQLRHQRQPPPRPRGRPLRPHRDRIPPRTAPTPTRSVLDTTLLSFTAGQRMKRAMVALEAAAAGEGPGAYTLASAVSIADTLRTMPFEVNLWQAQNIWNDLLRRSDKNYWSQEWKDGFKKLGLALNIDVDRLVIEEGVTAF